MQKIIKEESEIQMQVLQLAENGNANEWLLFTNENVPSGGCRTKRPDRIGAEKQDAALITAESQDCPSVKKYTTTIPETHLKCTWLHPHACSC